MDKEELKCSGNRNKAGPPAGKKRRKKALSGVSLCALAAVFVALIAIGVHMGVSPPKEPAVEIPESEVPLSEGGQADRYALNDKGLVSALSKMESGKYMLDNMLPNEEAKKFSYELYALHPEITLCYSPRFRLLGYDKDAGISVGYSIEFISEESGRIRYEELRAATDGIIDSLKEEPDDKKIEKAAQWIAERCSYTKSPKNMWDESLYGCLVKGTATCLGYSEGFFYLMDRLDVPCHIECTKYHAWNIVYDGENWTKLDLTKE